MMKILKNQKLKIRMKMKNKKFIKMNKQILIKKI